MEKWPFFSHIKPFLPLIAAATLLMGLATGLKGFLAILVGPVMDYVLVPDPPDRVLLGTLPLLSKEIYLEQINPFPFDVPWLVVGLLGVLATLAKGVSEYSSTYLVNYVGQSFVARLRATAYENVVYQSSHFFYNHTTGNLISRITNDIEKIQFAFSTNLADALKQTLTLLIFLGILFYLDWKLALIIFLAAPLIVLPSRILGQFVRRLSRASQEKLGQIAEILQESISGHRIVKAFSMEQFELDRFRYTVRQLARINLRHLRLQALPSPLMELLGALLLVPLLYYAQQAIGQGRMSQGDFGVFFVALVSLYEPMRRMSGIYMNFQHAKGASEKVFQIMVEPRQVVEKPDAAELSDFQRQIEFQQVSFNYPESGLPVLQRVNLRVGRGEVVALVGPSGSGKSSLVNLIPRFFDPTEGRVLIDGIDIRQLKLDSLRDLMGMVTQETILFNDTLRNNICYGRTQVTETEMRTAARAALAEEFILELPRQYDANIGERGQQLSGGQRQRLAIARALLKNAPILILDEATSSLDTESEILVQRALANLMRGRTVIVIAHRLSTIRRADRIVVIEQGKITEVGTHSDLMEKRGMYQRLHDLQVEGDGAGLPT
jgi:subfamily B ATP-binding cassette protein MsbA